MCLNRLEYDDIYLLEFENTVNYELLAQIYKQKEDVVAKALNLYEKPDPNAEVDILAIKRFEDKKLVDIVGKREEDKFLKGLITQRPT